MGCFDVTNYGCDEQIEFSVWVKSRKLRFCLSSKITQSNFIGYWKSLLYCTVFAHAEVSSLHTGLFGVLLFVDYVALCLSWSDENRIWRLLVGFMYLSRCSMVYVNNDNAKLQLGRYSRTMWSVQFACLLARAWIILGPWPAVVKWMLVFPNPSEGHLYFNHFSTDEEEPMNTLFIFHSSAVIS